MKAKEKAKELVEKYKNYTKSEYVIQLTLTVVDDIIDAEPMEEFGCSDSGTEYRSTDEFWQEVKEEINKL